MGREISQPGAAKIYVVERMIRLDNESKERPYYVEEMNPSLGQIVISGDFRRVVKTTYDGTTTVILEPDEEVLKKPFTPVKKGYLRL